MYYSVIVFISIFLFTIVHTIIILEQMSETFIIIVFVYICLLGISTKQERETKINNPIEQP